MRFHIITLGCPKNEVDSEGMEILLTEAGHSPVADFSEADLVVVNSCGFIDPARAESLDTLRDVSARRKPGSFLVAAGCLVQREGPSLANQVCGIDAFLGCRNWTDIARVVEMLVEGRAASKRSTRDGGCSVVEAREQGWKHERLAHAGEWVGRNPGVDLRCPSATSPREPGVMSLIGDELQFGPSRRRPRSASAYLKISDGCDAACSFCIIPAIKGGYRSKPLERVLEEVRQLVEGGVQEIVLIGQDTTAYGLDRGERDGLAGLLSRIVEVAPELHWLRVLYLYPQRITPRLLQTLAELPQVCKYVDIPLQHTHPAVLRGMGRPAGDVPRLVGELRDAIPDVAIRTTFIVGFPGETEGQHRHLLRTIEQLGFDRVGVFAYSPQEGTPAATLPDQVPESTKQRRWRETMEVAQRVSLRQNRKLVGRELDVLVEGVGKGTRGQAPTMVGRSYRDAPEVDGLVFFSGRAKVGEMVRVRITSALEYDLVGELVAGRGGMKLER